ncbi:RNA-binding protein 28 [Cylas formicarius]|uniref:RNA-binding protein 28 n=1 Tax=Cylas formicarius TaxID=197179 RepID=UPI002958DC75|nr:RNA-binding protein 28 [Cylas formicarius]
MGKKSQNPAVKKFIKEKSKAKRRESKQNLKQKRARIVVRNLSFRATVSQIKEHFEKFGEILNVELLKKEDGKLVGCAFIQYNLVQAAAKAKHYTHNQPFLGRNISVDFAKPKDKYTKTVNEQKKSRNIEQAVEIKDESLVEVKDKIEEEKFNIDNVKDEVHSEADSEESGQDEVVEAEPEVQKRIVSHDATEGRTVFIKNVPFQATNEDVKECMSQFGRIFYALVCLDKLTEHSRGTAFVKFVNKEDAEKALNAGTELTLLGNVLDCHLALDRNELQKKVEAQKEEKSKPKDSRNLYLVKEGVILAGTKAAEGVSVSDMAKRLQLEQYKTQMLRKLNTFVSRERLVIHNLPPAWDDNKLKMLVKKYAGEGAVIKEARVMRDMKRLDAKGVGPSKEYGFVTFTKHENALLALRALNNNPNIFSPQKRPIVTFSIESKSAIKAKLKRLEKSKISNPKSKNYVAPKRGQEADTQSEQELEDFAGVTSKRGHIPKTRARYKLNVQAKLHYENVKKEKRQQKMAKQSLQQKKEDFIRQPGQKIKKKKIVEDNFAKLVNEYKNKITEANVIKKKKWYA